MSLRTINDVEDLAGWRSRRVHGFDAVGGAQRARARAVRDSRRRRIAEAARAELQRSSRRHCRRRACGGGPAAASPCSSPRRTGRRSSASSPTTPGRSGDAAPLGVSAYEWSPDGKYLAYLTRDAGSVDAADRQPRRLESAGDAPVAAADRIPPGPARSITASNQYVDSFAWSPDSKEIAYAWAPVVGFLAPYQTKIFAVARRRRRRAADHRSSRHERGAAVLAGRPQDLLHLDRRTHRHHRAARSRRRRRVRHERERARLSDERRVDRRDPVGARQPGRLRDDERRARSRPARTCSRCRS